MIGRVFVMGDIHGNLLAFDQCVKRSGFIPERDTLIQLGDVSDRLPDTAKVVERLLEFKHLISIRGNHDDWTNKWLSTGIVDATWVANGGRATIESYEREKVDIEAHQEFFEKTQKDYYIDADNRIFVHGGFTHPKGPEYDLNSSQCLWDRSLWNAALIGQELNKKPDILSGFKEIFIGHTPTLKFNSIEPMNIFNVWNLDTGAGHPTGRLTIMELKTKAFWQSDITQKLYDTVLL